MHADENAREARFNLVPVYRVAIFLKTIPAYLKEHGFDTWEEIKNTVDDVVDVFIHSMAVITMYRSLYYIGNESLKSAIDSPPSADGSKQPSVLTNFVNAMIDFQSTCSGFDSVWPSLRDPNNLVSSSLSSNTFWQS